MPFSESPVNMAEVVLDIDDDQGCPAGLQLIGNSFLDKFIHDVHLPVELESGFEFGPCLYSLHMRLFCQQLF